jgi:DNA-binding protein HU-beta
MNDAGVITELSTRLNLEKREVESIIVKFSRIIGNELSNNNIVAIQGLGQFESAKKAEHISANPTNGEHYLIPPELVPVFKPVSTLKSYIKTLDKQ